MEVKFKEKLNVKWRMKLGDPRGLTSIGAYASTVCNFANVLNFSVLHLGDIVANIILETSLILI